MFEAGSFRDRDGRIVYRQSEVLRVLSENGLAQWKYVSSKRFFREALHSGKVIETDEVIAPASLSHPDDAPWCEVALRHARVPFISYPYEWSFGMLKAAALLQLDLLEAGFEEQVRSKDCSAYNIQWFGALPVFIDVGSFEMRRPGEIWPGYRQFCQMFLFPLMLQAYLKVPFQAWLRGNIEGIELENFANLISFRDLFRAGVFRHVFLHRKLQKHFMAADYSVRQELESKSFLDAPQLRLLKDLRRIVEGLTLHETGSGWVDYDREHSYASTDLAAKQAFVEQALRRKQRRLVWDMGCNSGFYSRLAAHGAEYVVALDSDHAIIDRLFASLRAEGNKSILPLVANMADPSPSLGWRGKERKSLEERGRPDLVLSLALIHHMVIASNIPLSELVDWLASLKADLVIEFVGKEDAMVKRLLQNKVDAYSDYSLENLIKHLERNFKLVNRQELKGGTRVILYCEYATV